MERLVENTSRLRTKSVAGLSALDNLELSIEVKAVQRKQMEVSKAEMKLSVEEDTPENRPGTNKSATGAVVELRVDLVLEGSLLEKVPHPKMTLFWH